MVSVLLLGRTAAVRSTPVSTDDICDDIGELVTADLLRVREETEEFSSVVDLVGTAGFFGGLPRPHLTWTFGAPTTQLITSGGICCFILSCQRRLVLPT